MSNECAWEKPLIKTPIPLLTAQPPQTTTTSTVSPTSYSAIVKSHTIPSIEPAVSAIQILGIIKKLLATLQKCPDFNAREEIINTVMQILNVIPDNHD
jgi:hypothetical protein